MNYKSVNLNRFLAIVLAVIMSMSVIPFTTFTALAANTTKYYVTVKDNSGDRVSDATFTAKSEGSSDVVATTSNYGLAMIELLQNTEYTYTISKFGYAIKSGVIDSSTNTYFEETITALNIVTVSGTVKDALNSSAIDKVTVSVSGYESKSTETDVDGNFSMQLYEGQDYDITLTHADYKSITQKVDFTNATANNFALKAKETVADFKFNVTSPANYEYGDKNISVLAASETYIKEKATYTVSPEGIVEIGENGELTFLKASPDTEVEVTATLPETDEHLETKTAIKIIVDKGAIPAGSLQWTNVIPENLTWEDTFTNTLTCNIDGAIKNVTYESSDLAKAEVDADGKVTFKEPCEVTITAYIEGNENYKNGSSSYTVKADKAMQKDFRFEDDVFPQLLVTKEATHVAIGGIAGAKVTYSASNSAIAEVDPNTGVVTGKDEGVVTITAKIEGNEKYEETEISYDLTVYYADHRDFGFVNSPQKTIDCFDTFDSKAFDPNNHTITYSSSDTAIASIDSNGQLTAHKAGKVTVSATVGKIDEYKENVVKYEIEVLRADPQLSFEKSEIPVLVYGGESFENAAKIGNSNGKDKLTIKYKSSNNDIISVDNNGKLTVEKAGSAKITASTAETEQFKATEISYDIVVTKANQIVSFDMESGEGNPVNTTFNANAGNVFVNASKSSAVESGETDIACTYKVISGSAYAEIKDDKKAEVTIIGATPEGQGIVVEVTYSANERYNEATKTYILTVNKDNQSISFPNIEREVVLGDSYFVASKATPNGTNYGTGDIIYSVKENSDNIVASIDPDTGDINFNNTVGSAIIRATKEADANYNEATAEYKLSVVYGDKSDDQYVLKGEKLNDSGWYTSDVSVEGVGSYRVGFLSSWAVWDYDKSVELSKDEGVSSKSFYTYNGICRGPYNVTIKIDKSLPRATISVDDISLWDKFVTIITGRKAQVAMKITAADDVSGVNKIEYCISDDVNVKTKEEIEKLTYTTLNYTYDSTGKVYNSDNVNIDADKKFVVYAKITDIAGNVQYVSTNGVVLDTTPPTAVITLPTPDVGSYYHDDVAAKVVLSDAEPYSGIKSASYRILCDGVETQNAALVSESDTNKLDNPKYSDLYAKWEVTQPIIVDAIDNNSSNVVVEVTTVDNAGNSSVTRQQLSIAAKAPTINVVFDETAIDKNAVAGYYNKARSADIVITNRERTFEPNNVEIVVIEKSLDGSTPINTYVIDDGAWITTLGATPEATTHKKKITFNGNARYTITVNYTDKAGRKADECFVDTFVVDKNKPIGIVTIAENTWDVLIDKLTFGLWSSVAQNITITADDAISEIKEIKYFKTNETVKYTAQMLENVTNWETYTAPINTEVNERLTVYAKLIDNAGNYNFISSDGYIVDSTHAKIELTPDKPSYNGTYQRDININTVITDAEPYSGINKVEYWVTSDGNETQRDVLYEFTYDNTKDEPVYSQLKNQVTNKDFSKELKVIAKNNNSSNVVVTVKVTDNAGNEWQESVENLDINVSNPSVSFEVTQDTLVDGTTNIYNPTQQGKVVIVDRPSHFDAEKATDSIKITAYNAEGKTVIQDCSSLIGDWDTVKNTSNIDKSTHTAYIDLSADAKYTVEILYKQTGIFPANKIEKQTIIVDDTKPTAVVKLNEGQNKWDALIGELTFGIWDKKSAEISIEANDATSGVKKIEYIKTDAITGLDANALDAIAVSGWKTYREPLYVEPDERVTYYFKVTDNADNYEYFSTDGVIIEDAESEINLTPDAPNSNRIYNKNVNVLLEVEEHEPYSGINKVEYWVTADGKETQRETLYQFEYDKTNKEPEYDQLQYRFSKNIIVDAEKNNSSNVEVNVRVTDNAGNVANNKIKLDIDITKPTISVRYDNIEPYKGYFFNAPREATIVITERANHFDPVEATNGIKISAVDVKGKTVIDDCSALISGWTPEKGNNVDSDTHTATIKYSSDAVYTFEISYTDMAGNANEGVSANDSHSPYGFVVDTNMPTEEIEIENQKWYSLVEHLTFGLWYKKGITIVATPNDETSGIESHEYYITDKTTALSQEDLIKIDDWQKYTGSIKIEPEKMFTIYYKVVDNSGNTAFFSSDGHIVDSVLCELTLTPDKPNKNNIYNKDVDIVVDVEDAEPYSGINKVEYWVTADGKETQRETLYQFEYEKSNLEPKFTQLKKDFSETITIDSKKNNSSKVIVTVCVTDNAGNVTSKKQKLDINITKPTIKVTYNNDEPYAVVDGRGYFPANREATVVYTVRSNHFDKNSAIDSIRLRALDSKGKTPSDQNGNPVTDQNGQRIFDDDGYLINPNAIISTWEDSVGVTPLQDTHTIKIDYSIDANYTFDISYTDMAGNKNVSVDTDNSVTPYIFTVDKVKSTALIDIDGNNWSQLLEFLTFGLWKNETVYVTATADDITTTPVVEYYKTSATELLTDGDLKEIKDWTLYEERLVIDKDERLTVYFKVTDTAGNVEFFSSDGYIVDKQKSVLELTPDKPNENNIYNKDVNIVVDVKDAEPYSGFSKIEYWVTADGEETQRETLYEFEYDKNNHEPRYEQLENEFHRTVVVESELNNSSYVVATVCVTDNAGNVTTESVEMDIDITSPTIDVSYNNNDDYKISNDNGYFDAPRTATVVITERANHFDVAAAIASIKITAVNAKGETVIKNCVDLISNWTTTEGETPDEAQHVATIDYSANANYIFDISYTDMAGNENLSVDTGVSVAPYKFTVDTVAPNGTVTVGDFGTWDTLIETLTFGLWSKDSVKVSGTTSDITADIESVSYYKTPDIVALKESELEALPETAWTAFDGFEVLPDEQFTVYLRIVDNSGNTTFISSNGVIVDKTMPEFQPSLESEKPEIVLAAVENDINGIFKSDVTMAVKVIDPVVGETYSGLKEIKYTVSNMGEVTQEGVLYNFDNKSPKQNELLQVWENEAAFVVDSKLNNSNDVKVSVYAVDNSGNEKTVETLLKLDITAPVIDVTYNNNDGDTSFKESTYFKANRIATVVVTERNFDPADVVVKITNTDKVIPVLSSWVTATAGENGDATTHTATITYSADGDYTFDISYVDEAGNSNNGVNYGNSLSPQKFTIDKTKPTFTVTYDNNEAFNVNYFKVQRIATIVVTEHNFETSRVNITLTATDNGAVSALPNISAWRSSGDIHTATITYSADSLYTFDFDYTDKAGNTTANIEQQTFYVDKTNPVLSITGISDQSANSGAGKIGFVMTATDTNFDTFTPTVSITDATGNSRNVAIGATTDVANGRSYVVNDIPEDGIYRVTCTVVDKAGNAYTEVRLQRADGSTYVENRAGNTTLVTFSVNRDGSTYEVNKNTAEVLKNYYVQQVVNDVVIVEVNADSLDEYSITLNDKELVEGKDYKVAQTGGNGSWYRYTYTVNKSLFAKEGEYKLVVESKDRAGNDAFSDVKDATVNFVVDRTAPIVTVTGMATKGRYQTESQTVTIMPTDDGGALKSLIVRFVDKDGKVIEEIMNLEGEKLEEALEKGNGKLTFKIEEGDSLYQNVQIICNDYAVDVDGNTNVYNETFTDISVSSSAFMIFWANKPLRWGVIGGITLIIALIIFFIIKKSKKDENNKEEKNSNKVKA